MKKFGEIVSYNVDKSKINITYTGGKATLEVIRDDIINVFSPFENEVHHSVAIEGNKTVKTDFSVLKTKDALVIETDKIVLYAKDNFMFDFCDKAGNCLCRDSSEERVAPQDITEEEKRMLSLEGHSVPENYTDFSIFIKKEIMGDECFYGLGDKTGYLNKRNYQYRMWNTDDPRAHEDFYEVLYKTIPFLITLKNNGIYGLFFDNPYMTTFNMGKENPKFYWYGTYFGNIDYYYIAGNDFKDILSAYTYLTGTTPLPQTWALGYQQSRFGYMDEKDIMTVAENMRKNKVPCDVIHFDIDYMDEFKVFTFNKEGYPDEKATIKKLGDMGFKAVTIIDPGVKVQKGYDIYDTGLKNDYFVKDKNGLVYVGKVWPGDSVYPDFGNPEVRDWWGENTSLMTQRGVAGIWNDMNEPASFAGELPDDLVMTDEDIKTTHRRMHNTYGHNMSKATYYGLKKHTGKRPFVITRACYAGSQKYTTAWTGDNKSIWTHIKMAIPQLCNLGLSGMAFVGTDIGGFASDTTPELLARWIELGAFSPLCRNHCSKGCKNQEPWVFGKEVLDIFRKYIELRYSLLPYFYDNFRICEEKGYPVMRPLVFNYCHDEVAKNCNTEFMIGDSMLVAPVIEQGDIYKCVYLPEGAWYDYFTGERVEGNSHVVKYAPLDTCPIYIKEGTILPTYEVQQYVGEKENDTLYLEIFGNRAAYVHYTDNGTDFKYRDGEYNVYNFAYENGEFTAKLSHKGIKTYKNIVIKKGEKTVTAEFTDGMKVSI